MKLPITIFAIFFFSLIFVTNSNGQTEDDKPLKIKSQPQPQYTQQTCDGASGVVRLRVTFDKSEKISDVELAISSGCEKFDKMAIKAAKKIKFKPAMKNGKPVSTRSLIEYTFTIY